jgi:hypothetical protein
MPSRLHSQSMTDRSEPHNQHRSRRCRPCMAWITATAAIIESASFETTWRRAVLAAAKQLSVHVPKSLRLAGTGY